MAGFEGWWVNGETGKGLHVAEHWMEVRSNPEHYGLTEDEVQAILKSAKGKFSMGDTDQDGQRVKLLTAAMRNGWVRVRGYKARYSIEMLGHAASYLPKVLTFLKRAGVHPNSEILVHDLASKYSQRFMDGMSEVVRAIKQGKVPDVAGEAESGLAKPSAHGIRTDLDDKQQRTIMRQRLGQRIHLPDPSPSDDRIEERKALRRGLTKVLG
jgi:hypothetical protein